MSGSFAIARLGGAEVRVHWSWVVMLALVTVFVGGDALPAAAPNAPAVVVWPVAVATALLGLLSVTAHELAHVFVAQRNRIDTRPVTIQLLGGAYILEARPTTPGQQLRLAAAGPTVSFALCLIFAVVAAVADVASLSPLVWTPAVLLSTWNFFVTVINLVPGYPLDGASIVRALIWRATGREESATAITGRIGRTLGLAMMLGGVAIFVLTDRWGGIFLSVVGWLLSAGGTAVERREFLRGLVAGLRVADAIEADTPRVPPQLTLDTFASQYLSEPGCAVVVTRPGELLGIVGSTQARRTRGRNWTNLHASDVLTPLAKVPRVAAGAELWPVLEQLERSGLDALVVDPETLGGNAIEAGAAPTGSEPSGDVDGAEIALVTRRSAARAIHQRAQQRIEAAMVLGQVASRLGVKRAGGLFGRRTPRGPQLPPSARSQDATGLSGPPTTDENASSLPPERAEEPVTLRRPPNDGPFDDSSRAGGSVPEVSRQEEPRADERAQPGPRDDEEAFPSEGEATGSDEEK